MSITKLLANPTPYQVTLVRLDNPSLASSDSAHSSCVRAMASPSPGTHSPKTLVSEPTLPPPNSNVMGMPMGFAAQIKALQETQRQQAERIAFLEHKNAELKTCREQDLLTRIEALEQHNQHLSARRKEAVSQLLNLRTLHQEANNAFHLRSIDIQPDDLEGMLTVYGASVTSVVSHHQHALARLSAGQMLTYGANAYHAHHAGQNHHPIGPTPSRCAYPVPCTHSGYCLVHHIPYSCQMCDG